MQDSAVLKFAQTAAGGVVQIAGRGTMQESAALLSFIEPILSSDSTYALIVDLSVCDYLDSTFLGTLVLLDRRYSAGGSTRFRVFASREQCTKLLHASRLDRVLTIISERPASDCDWQPVPAAPMEQDEFIRHLIECHQRLSELGGPSARGFQQVADQLSRELRVKSPG